MSGDAILRVALVLIHLALSVWQFRMLAEDFPDRRLLPFTSKRMTKATQQIAKQPSYKDVPEQDVVIQGWRKFSVVPYYGDTSPNVMLQGAWGHAWKTRCLTATCLGEKAEKHLAHGECTCGVYSTRTRDALWEKPWHVVALVVNYGWVVPAERGFRAQHCRIEKLFVPRLMPGYDNDAMERLVAALAERYEVPVERETANDRIVTEWTTQDGAVRLPYALPYAPDFTSRNP